MKECSWRYKLVTLHLERSYKLEETQSKIKMQLYYQEARMRILLYYFQKEVDHCVNSLKHSKDKDDRFLGWRFDRFYNSNFAEKVLRIYVDRCKLKQGLAFF